MFGLEQHSLLHSHHLGHGECVFVRRLGGLQVQGESTGSAGLFQDVFEVLQGVVPDIVEEGSLVIIEEGLQSLDRGNGEQKQGGREGTGLLGHWKHSADIGHESKESSFVFRRDSNGGATVILGHSLVHLQVKGVMVYEESIEALFYTFGYLLRLPRGLVSQEDVALVVVGERDWEGAELVFRRGVEVSLFSLQRRDFTLVQQERQQTVVISAILTHWRSNGFQARSAAARECA